MKEEDNLPPEGNSTNFTRMKLASMMKEWYGEDAGRGEMLKHLPQFQSIGDVMSRVTGKTLPKSVWFFSQIAASWSTIAGSVAEKHTIPVSLFEKTLLVEIAHPAYLMALNTPRVKNAILARVADLIGEGHCTSVQFVPCGRKARTPST